MFALPPPPTEGTEEDRLSGIFDESTDEDSDDEYSGPSSSRLDFENLDINSKDFKALPPDIRHELLLEMQQARKRPSWNSSNRLPAESDTFSQFQIGRLLTRSQVGAIYWMGRLDCSSVSERLPHSFLHQYLISQENQHFFLHKSLVTRNPCTFSDPIQTYSTRRIRDFPT